MTTIAAIVITAVLVFFSPILGVALGAFSGWCVSLVFEETVKTSLLKLGVNTNGLELWQIGATLGFLGAYFRPVISNTRKD